MNSFLKFQVKFEILTLNLRLFTNDLPQLVISVISANFKAQNKLLFSTAILKDGFSLFVKSATEYERRDKHISLHT